MWKGSESDTAAVDIQTYIPAGEWIMGEKKQHIRVRAMFGDHDHDFLGRKNGPRLID